LLIWYFFKTIIIIIILLVFVFCFFFFFVRVAYHLLVFLSHNRGTYKMTDAGGSIVKTLQITGRLVEWFSFSFLFFFYFFFFCVYMISFCENVCKFLKLKENFFFSLLFFLEVIQDIIQAHGYSCDFETICEYVRRVMI